MAEGSNISISVSDYFSTMLDQSMDWDAAAEVRRRWGKAFCLKGIMSVEDAQEQSILARRDYGVQPRRPTARWEPSAFRSAG